MREEIVQPDHFIATYYPKATSNDIMTMNPTIDPIDAIFPLPLECASGIMSSITTQIIAPAANAKA